MYNAELSWEKIYNTHQMAWPAEYVVRMLKGNYPNLALNKSILPGMKICDIGFGDGRNFPVYNQLNLDMYGVEITEDIVNKAIKNLTNYGLSKFDLRVGNNKNIPYDSNLFDYLLSWNACYYMGNNKDFNEYVLEFSRVLKNAGTLILSIPKKTCFIYKNSTELKPGYKIINEDPFNVRNGEVLRMFDSEQEIQETFSSYFQDFVFGSIEDDCFGFNYHWHLVVCRKKS